MPEAKYDLREIARSALGEMPEYQRGPFLTALLCELNGRDAPALLASAHNAITLRLGVLVDERCTAEGRNVR